MCKSLTRIVSFIIFLSFPCLALGSPTAKLTAKIISEEGSPIQNAEVTLSFSHAKIGDGGGLANSGVDGLSDINGLFTGESETLPYTGVVVDKAGYYRSIQKYEFKTSSGIIFKKWEPWNPTIEVVLKKIRNPRPVYRKYLEALQVPAFGKPVGYDFEKGDWVNPYGSGLNSDLIFNCDNSYTNFNKARSSCDITFSNPFDGLSEFEFDKSNQSLFRWSYEAPTTGYKIKKIHIWMSVDLPSEQYKNNYKKTINYIFRVRTKVDQNGNVIKANYGKIAGDFRVYKKGEVNFSYSYNPDGTRYLEEGENLFPKKRP